MIASVSGRLLVRKPGHVVIDCAGVGYALAVSAETLSSLPRQGAEATLHTHLVMRDDALNLYGFASESERELFLMLVSVQGVGPKVALGVLSGGTAAELLRAIAAGDGARFQAVPGIGKRTADRIIVELRERVAAGAVADEISVTRSEDPRTLAREGLLGLGFTPARGRRDARRRRRGQRRAADRRGAERGRVSTPPAEGGIRTPGVERLQGATVVGAAEDDFDRSLRPRKLGDFVGQHAVKEQLGVSIEAARARGEALDHVLLSGPPGLGKTSLAQIVANELDVPFVQTAGPALERKGDLAALLTALEPRSVFFVDEIHRLQSALEETFYPAMEDRSLPVTVGQGPGAKVVNLPLKAFTLIGATTREGLLTAPLRDRFEVLHRLNHYDEDDLVTIVTRSAGILEIEIDEPGAAAIAARSRGTPRVANRLLKRVRDFAQVRGAGRIDADAAGEALGLLEIDSAGLDRLDRAILQTICEKFAGGPVGLSTLAAAVHEEQDTLEGVYEPYLLQLGLMKRTPKGRVATPAAFAHLGLELPKQQGAASLF